MRNEPTTLDPTVDIPKGTAVSLVIRPGPVDTALTGRQIAIVDFIRDHIDRRGYPPSVREIGDAVELSSTSSVHHQLRRLEKLGVLSRRVRRSRAICLAGSMEAA